MKLWTWRKRAISLLMAVTLILGGLPAVSVGAFPFPGDVLIWALPIVPELAYSLDDASTIDSAAAFRVIPVREAGSDIAFSYESGSLAVRNRSAFWEGIDILLYEEDFFGDRRSVLEWGVEYRLVVEGRVEDTGWAAQGLHLAFPLDDDPWEYPRVVASPGDSRVSIHFDRDVPARYGLTQSDAGHRIRIRTDSESAAVDHDFVITSVRLYAADAWASDIAEVWISGPTVLRPGETAHFNAMHIYWSGDTAWRDVIWEAEAIIHGHVISSDTSNPYFVFHSDGRLVVSNAVPNGTIITITARSIDAPWVYTIHRASVEEALFGVPPAGVDISVQSVVPMHRVGVLPHVRGATTAARVITVHRIAGDDANLSRDGARFTTPRVGQRLSAGNVLTTGRDSFMYLQMDADSVLKMDETSQVAVSSARRRLTLSVQSGNALVTAGAQEEGTTLETRVGNVGLTVRGTMFTMGYAGENAVSITMLAGSGEVNGQSLPAGNSMSVSAVADVSVTAQAIDINALDYFTLNAIYDNFEYLVDAGTFDADVMDVLPGLIEARGEELREAREAADAEAAAEGEDEIAMLIEAAEANGAARPPTAAANDGRSDGGDDGGGITGGGTHRPPVPSQYQYRANLSGIVIEERAVGSLVSAVPGVPAEVEIRLVAPAGFEWSLGAGAGHGGNAGFASPAPSFSAPTINPAGRHEITLRFSSAVRPDNLAALTTRAQIRINGLVLTNTAPVATTGNVAIDVYVNAGTAPAGDSAWQSRGLVVAAFPAPAAGGTRAE